MKYSLNFRGGVHRPSQSIIQGRRQGTKLVSETSERRSEALKGGDSHGC